MQFLYNLFRKLNKPGEQPAGLKQLGRKLRNDPMNLLGVMPAKEG